METSSASLRLNSIKLLKELGLPAPSSLPLLDLFDDVRPLEDIIQRVFILHSLAASSYGLDRSIAREWLEREVDADSMTAAETDYLETGFGDTRLFKSQIESNYALCWAVSIVDVLEPQSPCPESFVALLPDLLASEDGNLFRRKAKLRTIESIYAECDVYYCLHWTMVEEKLQGRRSLKISPSLIENRRHAIEWLVSDLPWNRIELDT